jgi:hypothetical protein
MAALQDETGGARNAVLWNPIPMSATIRTTPIAKDSMIPMVE